MIEALVLNYEVDKLDNKKETPAPIGVVASSSTPLFDFYSEKTLL